MTADPKQAAVAKIVAAHRAATGLPREQGAELVARVTADAVADLVAAILSRGARQGIYIVGEEA